MEELVRYISSTYKVNKDIKVNLKILVTDKFMEIDKAIPCGIIINELLSNSYKHAFNEVKKGRVDILFANTKNNDYQYLLKVSDNGSGIKEKINLKSPSTLGLQLISALTDQIDGHLTVETKKGTAFTFTF